MSLWDPWYQLGPGRKLKVLHWVGLLALVGVPLIWLSVFIGLSEVGLFEGVPRWADRTALATLMGVSVVTLLQLKGRS